MGPKHLSAHPGSSLTYFSCVDCVSEVGKILMLDMLTTNLMTVAVGQSDCSQG